MNILKHMGLMKKTNEDHIVEQMAYTLIHLIETDHKRFEWDSQYGFLRDNKNNEVYCIVPGTMWKGTSKHIEWGFILSHRIKNATKILQKEKNDVKFNEWKEKYKDDIVEIPSQEPMNVYKPFSVVLLLALVVFTAIFHSGMAALGTFMMFGGMFMMLHFLTEQNNNATISNNGSEPTSKRPIPKK